MKFQAAVERTKYLIPLFIQKAIELRLDCGQLASLEAQAKACSIPLIHQQLVIPLPEERSPSTRGLYPGIVLCCDKETMSAIQRKPNAGTQAVFFFCPNPN